MLQIQYIREHTQEVIERLAKKNFEAKIILKQILEKDDLRKETQNQLDEILA